MEKKMTAPMKKFLLFMEKQGDNGVGAFPVEYSSTIRKRAKERGYIEECGLERDGKIRFAFTKFRLTAQGYEALAKTLGGGK
jgi:hypothetical protein